MRSYLEAVAERKRSEVAAAKRVVSLAALREECAALSPARSLRTALRKKRGVIAELKRRSPSRGELAPDADAAATARRFEAHGAAAMSVLTDGPDFEGSLSDLANARGASVLPLLRKDFVIDPYQLAEARAAGADVALVILALTGPSLAGELIEEANSFGLEVLLEVHTATEFKFALESGAPLVGVNCRDLHTLEVCPERHLELAPLAGESTNGPVLIAESGIKTAEAAAERFAAGFAGLLIGEAFSGSETAGPLLSAILDAADAMEVAKR